MNRLAGILALMAVLTGCAGSGSGRAQADQDRDGRLIAGAIGTADAQGTGFRLDETMVLSGGDVPSGREFRLRASVRNGVLRAGSARFTYHIQQNRSAVDYEMVIAENRLFVRQSKGGPWKAVPVDSATALFPALRLQLLRETVLLAQSVSGWSFTHADAGFAHRYVVRPAPEQLEQLESIPVQGRAEALFLRSATGRLEIFLVVPGDKLGRVEAHVTGTDPDNGTRQQVDSVADFQPARVGEIHPPERAIPVTPGEIFT